MISLAELKRKSLGAGVDIAIIEKDYVLSWILKGIFGSNLAKSLVFKGGTALSKAYFKNYRFSEDLDFTICKNINTGDIESILVKICEDVSSESGIELNFISLDQTRDEIGKEAFESKIAYIGPRTHRGNPGRIKLDLTAYEKIFLPKATLPLIHSYSDECQATITAYQLEEILAEKLRTIIQRAYPRDLYDAWYILKFYPGKLNFEKATETYHKKCDYKNVSLVDWQVFLKSDGVAGKKVAFANSLGKQIKTLPPFPELLEELRRSIKNHLDL